MLPYSFRPRKCKHCRESFMPERVGQIVHASCVLDYVKALSAKKQAQAKAKQRAEAKVERAQIRHRKEAIKKTSELVAPAQDAFNAYIRARDRDKGCFVCGKPFPVGQMGGDFDAGHVRSRGAAKHLRFNEDNCHGECKECNAPWGAKPHQIEAGAIRRIGQERYEALKNDNTPHKWTKEELRQIRATYKQKLKELD